MSIEVFDSETNKTINQDKGQAEREAAVRVIMGQEFLGSGSHIVKSMDVDTAKFLAHDYGDGNGTHRAEPLPAVEPKRVE